MKTMYGYKVNIKRTCISSEREDKEWGSWEDVYDNHLDSIITPEGKYPDVTTIHDIGKGQPCLVVWAEWSSGDSFGTGVNSGTEILGIFKEMSAAQELQRALETLEEDAYNIKTSDGQVFKCGFASWRGYFESLTGIHIDMATCF